MNGIIDTEPAIRDAFISGDIKAHYAIRLLKSLGYTFNDAVTLVEAWIKEHTNWQ
jgi:hypothetical protein